MPGLPWEMHIKGEADGIWGICTSRFAKDKGNWDSDSAEGNCQSDQVLKKPMNIFEGLESGRQRKIFRQGISSCH